MALPVPLGLEVILIQLALLVAFHAHPVAAVTVTLPAPPAAAKEADVGCTSYVQEGVGGGGGAVPA